MMLTDNCSMSSLQTKITVIHGDGIGQEVTNAALKILRAATSQLVFDVCLAGELAFKQGIASGVPEKTLQSIHANRVVLKGPLSTPIGYGERSANVFLRKHFGLFANVRPVKQYPNIPSLYKDIPIDLVVIRENIEDLYAGIEYFHQPSIAQSIKLISQYGCDHINTFAFEYAKLSGRSSVHCATKANILKATEGLMKRSFESVSDHYPMLEAHHMIIDNCAHQLVINPSQFDMIVTTNMNGDIISDLTSGLVGGLGIAPSANIGRHCAMFEAVHGAAPDIAGQNKANPTAMILSAIMMCRYIGLDDVANSIEQALAVTFSDAKMTIDLMPNSPLSTTDFCDAVISNLGRKHPQFVSSKFSAVNMPSISNPPIAVGACYGVDVVIVSNDSYSLMQSTLMDMADETGFQLHHMCNRGQSVLSDAGEQLIAQWSCRFYKDACNSHDISSLISKIAITYEWMQLERLVSFE